MPVLGSYLYKNKLVTSFTGLLTWSRNMSETNAGPSLRPITQRLPVGSTVKQIAMSHVWSVTNTERRPDWVNGDLS
jgi:hypothetical protein